MHRRDIQRVRTFNRAYTRIIGLLDRHLLNSPYTLQEVRVMYEVHHRPGITSKEVAELLGMDKGYLSRMLAGFERKGLIRKEVAREDGRAQEISLTKRGEKDLLAVDEATYQQISDLLKGMTKAEVRTLVGHMDGILKVFSKVGPEP